MAAGLLAAIGGAVFAIDPTLTGVAQFLGLLTLGLGLGLSMAPCLVAAQTAVVPREVGVVTATVALCRTLGGAIGIAVLSSILFAVVGAASTAGGASLSVLLAEGARGAAPSPSLVQGFRLAFATASAMSLLVVLLGSRLPAGLSAKHGH